MKEKVSLKRQSRRYKSESSSKEEHSCSNQRGKLMKDGKEICPIPLVDCLCPDQVVDREDPENSVKMLCSNRSCSFSSNAFVHMECFQALEEKI
uniref:Headcase N-terminal domain-containing protein n=1 Tax=Panagrolaimus davidi TaxID=227884 RepID=A0A914QIZ7_9BILA